MPTGAGFVEGGVRFSELGPRKREKSTGQRCREGRVGGQSGASCRLGLRFTRSRNPVES